MFEFGLPWLFVLAPLPWLWALVQRVYRQRLARTVSADNREHGVDAQTDVIWAPLLPRWQQLPVSPSANTRSWREQLLPALLWLLLLIAGAQPRWLGEPLAQQRSGRDLMLVVDLSGSMEASDLTLHGQEANRLQVLKAVLGEFIERRLGDRLGLVLFGEQAYLQAPLSFDRPTVNQFLQDSEIGLAGAKRTAIGDGLALGLKHLQESSSLDKTLILVTDGVNNTGRISPEQATELAQKLQVKVYSIGVGADEMLVRDLFFGTRRVNPSAELDEEALRKIAQTTGGQYFRARDQQEMQAIYRAIDQLEPVQSDAKWLRPQRELYPYPLVLALLLSMLALASKPLLLRLRQRRQSAAATAATAATATVSAR